MTNCKSWTVIRKQNIIYYKHHSPYCTCVLCNAHALLCLLHSRCQVAIFNNLSAAMSDIHTMWCIHSATTKHMERLICLTQAAITFSTSKSTLPKRNCSVCINPKHAGFFILLKCFKRLSLVQSDMIVLITKLHHSMSHITNRFYNFTEKGGT